MGWFILSIFTLTAPGVFAQDEVAVRAIVSRYVDARELRSTAAVEALFTEDADQLVSTGEWRRGREAIVKGTLASSESTGGHRSITVEAVRFISADIALVDGRYVISGLQGGLDRRMWSTFLMKRTSDGWRIAAIRNMLPAAPVAR